ncbi:M81 family metallopeptidase [Thermomicrobium sp. CFH 73360]|uniref:M81 family metallopeptidase n=1 Tax=Thermomicrobium sp. CFH 73360 TaxID=2951987 RepID=UPI00207767CD|nr:M81 family metallopeptidase [Thermomicrobium sp. CFH 73360]MCM8746769.1 M81 family metallopeptidase [Thermomicrobium sp. CFH 73360]
MRIGIAWLTYRSNTFALTPGKLSAGWGEDPKPAVNWLRTMLEPLAQRLGLELVNLCDVQSAGGSVSTAEFLAFLQQFDETLDRTKPIDALLLHTSGTLVVDGMSGDVLLLQHLRQRHPTLPIAVLVDHVAQLPPDITDVTPLILGPHRWPPRDRPQRLERALDLLRQWARGRIQPTLVVHRLPLVFPLAVQRTDIPPFDRLSRKLAAWEAHPNVLTTSVLGGFPYADVSYAGASVIVITDGDSQLGNAIAHELGQELLELRNALHWPTLTIEEAIHRAMTASDHPVVLLDTGDAPEAGAPGEGTAALWAALDLGARGTIVSAIVDPEAVEIAHRAGPGITIELELGGKHDHRHGYPIPVRGVVRRIGAGIYRRRSPLAPGQPVDVGPSVWLELEGRYHARVDVIVTSKPGPFDDPELLFALGLSPHCASVLVLKSALDAFAWCHDSRLWKSNSFPKEVIQALTPGISTTDLSFFTFRQLPRPIWPLDEL